MSGLTGPLSNSFNQGPEAVQALFSAINAAGGICGRKLNLMIEDDGQNASTNASDIGDLISKNVFAFAGSTSDADNGGVPQMVQANVPDVGFAINCNRTTAPTYWSPTGGSCDVQNGHYYVNNGVFMLAKANGYLPSRMAFIAYNIAISAQAAQQYAIGLPADGRNRLLLGLLRVTGHRLARRRRPAAWSRTTAAACSPPSTSPATPSCSRPWPSSRTTRRTWPPPSTGTPRPRSRRRARRPRRA